MSFTRTLFGPQPRRTVQTVFTPRSKDVNTEMYVERPELEKALHRSVTSHMHTFLFGESGNGKSWLYKHVLKKSNISYVSINCGNVSRLKSITNEILNACFSVGHSEKISYEEEKEASVKAVVAEGRLQHTGKFNIHQDESLLRSFKAINEREDGRLSVIVIDNLEFIFDKPELLEELCSIILLLDDERYGKYNIKFLIVGIPNGVLEFFSKISNIESVSNRISELPKVSGLGQNQVLEIVKRGFVEQLGITLSPAEIGKISKHIFDITLGVAQRVHEYCTHLGHKIEDSNWKFQPDSLEKADQKWLIQGLRASYAVIESHMNSKETAVGRRNQVIFAIGQTRSHQFSVSDVEDIIKREFPETIPETNMGIGAILSELTKSDKPLVQKVGKITAYSIKDPRYIMCIRLVLYKNKDGGRIEKKHFARS